MRHSFSPPLSFLQPGGRGFTASASKRETMRAIILSASRSNSFWALGFTMTEYLATQLPALDEVGFQLFERDAFLATARLGDEHVLNVLPKCLVLFEVDDGGGFAALVVGDELDSGHRLLLNVCSSPPYRPAVFRSTVQPRPLSPNTRILRRLRAKPNKIIVDVHAASPSSRKTPCMPTRIAS